MAYTNIDERRDFVKHLLKSGIHEKHIKKQAAALHECHISAIVADIQFIRHAATGSYHVGTKMRKVIFQRDGKKCQYCLSCTAYEYVVDHIIPASQGGKSVPENLTISCSSCNIYKKKQIWVPINFMEISKDNENHLRYVLENATKDFR